MSGMSSNSLDVSRCINNVRNLKNLVLLIDIAAAKEEIFIPVVSREGNFEFILYASLKKLSENGAGFGTGSFA